MSGSLVALRPPCVSTKVPCSGGCGCPMPHAGAAAGRAGGMRGRRSHGQARHYGTGAHSGGSLHAPCFNGDYYVQCDEFRHFDVSTHILKCPDSINNLSYAIHIFRHTDEYDSTVIMITLCLRFFIADRIDLS